MNNEDNFDKALAWIVVAIAFAAGVYFAIGAAFSILGVANKWNLW